MANWNNLWQLVLVNPLAEVIEKLKKADEANDVRTDYLFLTVEEAVAALSSGLKSQPPSTEEEEEEEEKHTLVTEC